MSTPNYFRGRAKPVVDPQTLLRVALTETVEQDRIGDVVAAVTESPEEAKIDVANGLRHQGGRRPVQADFDGLMSPVDESGNVVGANTPDEPFELGIA